MACPATTSVRASLCLIGIFSIIITSWAGLWDHQPPTVKIWIYPSGTIYQGETAAIWLCASEPLKVVAAFLQPDSIAFYAHGEDQCVHRALVGIPPAAPSGPCTLHITASDSADNTSIAHVLLTVVRTDFPEEQLTFGPEKTKYLDPAPLARDIAKISGALTHSDQTQMWQFPFTIPTEGRVSSSYGAIRVYNNGLRQGQHRGVDLANAEGTPVHAPAAGLVVLSEELEVHGNTIIIDHGQQVFSILAHLDERIANVEQTVHEGEVVGTIGSTGLATGPHLHWGLSVGNVRVQPLQWTDTTMSRGLQPPLPTGG
jgi:hypothetical protein